MTLLNTLCYAIDKSEEGVYMQAVILAAGNGTRLGRLTKAIPKCMVEVNGVSMIERSLSVLDEQNLSRIIIVLGFEGDKLQNYVESLNLKTEVVFVTNEVYNTTNNIYSLYKAKDFLLEEDTLLLESDLVFDKAAVEMVLQSEYPTLALLAKHEIWMDGTVVTLNEDDDITRFISKDEFDYDKTDEYYKTVNIYKFSKEFSQTHYVPFLVAYSEAMGHNEYYEQVLKVIAHLDQNHLKGLVMSDVPWYEVDDVNDLEIAEVIFAPTIEDKFNKLMSKFGGYWRYVGMKDFCYLVNPFYPKPQLMDEMIHNFERLLRDYPSGLNVNTSLVGKYFNVQPETIVVGNGASELIKSLLETFTGKTGFIAPTFEEYPNRIDVKDRVVFDSSEVDYQYSGDDIINFFDDKDINQLILINPDNPSGNYLDQDEVIKVVEWCQTKDILCVLDESFIDFMNNDEKGSLMTQDILDAYKNLVVIKSISKSHGVPGVRLGVLLTSDEDIISMIKKDVSIWNINSFGEYYMQIAGKYKKDFIHGLERFYDARDEMMDALNIIDFIKVYPSQANYIMIELHEGVQALDIAYYLLEHHNVLIKDLSNKQGFKSQMIRVAVKTPEENRDLVQGMKDYWSKRHA